MAGEIVAAVHNSSEQRVAEVRAELANTQLKLKVERFRRRESESCWRLLAGISDLLGGDVDPRTVLPEVCRRASEAIEGDCGVAITLLKGRSVQDVAVQGESEPALEVGALKGRVLDVGSVLWSAVNDLRTAHVPVVAPGLPLLQSSSEPLTAIRSAVIAPFEVCAPEVGAVVAFGDEASVLNEPEVRLIEHVAACAGVALANARLRESVSQHEAALQEGGLKEDLIASITHDIQTPLAAVCGMVQALADGERPQPEDERGFYEAMLRQAVRLRHLVIQFLDFTRMEAGPPLIFNPAPTDVMVPVELIAQTFMHSNPIEIDISAGLPPALVDSDRLMQVLANLLSNGAKFSPPGSPIRIVGREVGEEIELAVIDQGCGMRASDLANAFEKYFRGSTAAGTPGSGLGLYISREIVERQGGRITATSRIGEGSNFVVRLPKAPI
jgi:signal transduction histidine kinase